MLPVVVQELLSASALLPSAWTELFELLLIELTSDEALC
jgi:hypothetical protein